VNRYPNISDHGLILQTAALVKQLYMPGTAMLITRFMTPDGVGEVLDFMPVAEDKPTDRHRLVRYLRVARGTTQFVLDLQPRFDYGRARHTTEVSEGGAVFRSDSGIELTLHSTGSGRGAEGAPTVEPTGDGLRVTFTMREGESGRGVVLESIGGPPQRLPTAELERLAGDTAAYWKRWLARSTYTGRWREMVDRSAMTLKLMTYAPTGAPVAAATLGLPEQAGGEQNWDYRFTWIRDGSLSMHALAGLGYLDEAAKFGAWLRDRVTEGSAGNGSSPLKIMYRVDGSSELTEQTLGHFEGWRGSRPVRIGNGAADQLQLDIFGEALDAILTGDDAGLPSRTQAGAPSPRSSTGSPTTGTSPTKASGRPVAAARISPMADSSAGSHSTGRSGWPSGTAAPPTPRSGLPSATGSDQIMDRGWNDKIKAFTQHYATDVLDSSLLLMPLEGFISPADPMWLSTLQAMDGELVSDSLVYRYNPAASPDGLHGDEGTFSLCTFLYVDALARAGRLDDAVLTFEKMLTYGNHLGLFSEEIGSTGEQLGNFAQAFTHLSLINAAITLNGQIDRRAPGRADAERGLTQHVPRRPRPGRLGKAEGQPGSPGHIAGSGIRGGGCHGQRDRYREPGEGRAHCRANAGESLVRSHAGVPLAGGRPRRCRRAAAGACQHP
jgi:GH15 family glucan-1,4-alpha-glucosidase